ncbi:MAG: hypothetical protein ACYDIE_12660 [Candidatus Krumholzibacteriia bacterium]
MKLRTPMLLVGLALMAALGLAGCGTDQPTTTTTAGAPDDYSVLDLDAEFGGLTATDEPAAFGDVLLEQAVTAEAGEVADDPLAVDPQVAEFEALAVAPDDSTAPPRPRVTFLRLVWGVLDSPVDSLGTADDGPDLVDWSGRIQVDRGLVIVRRVIGFERPRDFLLPRVERNSVSWVSHTGPASDGLLIEILEPPVLPDSTGALPPPNRLRLRTAPYAAEYLVDELAGLDATCPVLPEGNAIHLTGFRPDICPRGFLAGFWHAGSDSAGAFRGRWLGLQGVSDGFLRGGYGYDSEGRRVMVGKWISTSGLFRGLLRGTWEPLPEPGHGRFHGEWVNRAGTVEGEFGGDFLAAPERPGGFFAGRWAVLCPGGEIVPE